MLGFAALFAAIFLYKKTESRELLITWLPLTGVLMEFWIAFLAGTIQLFHIPVNTLSMGLVNLLIGILLLLRIRKKGEIQKYSLNAYDVIFALLILMAVLYVCNIRY